jgi:hypothetical protein
MTTSILNRAESAFPAATPPAALGFVLVIFLRFPPGQYSFYPECPFNGFFHLQCPGCGATRAVAALLHGDIAAAIHFNALVSLLFPAAIVYGVALYIRFLKRVPIRCPQPRFAVVCALFAVTILFGVTRNLFLF